MQWLGRGIHVYVALCSVKTTEEERNTGFPHLLFRSPLFDPLSPSNPPLCVLVFIQMFEFDWQFLQRPCTSGWLVSSAFCIPGKEKRSGGTESSGQHQQADGLRVLVFMLPVWFWQLNWSQRCCCVMFKGRFKVTLLTGPPSSDSLNIYIFL